MTDKNHAQEQAKAQYESIAAMVAALDMDWDRLEELREELAEVDTPRTQAAFARFDASELGDELRSLEKTAGDYKSQEEAQEAIQQGPLSVQVRSDWVNPGESMTASEFNILLCTGGPAVRIIGELGQHGEPESAVIEYQDWGTPWTEYHEGVDRGVLLRYCSTFYFGE